VIKESVLVIVVVIVIVIVTVIVGVVKTVAAPVIVILELQVSRQRRLGNTWTPVLVLAVKALFAALAPPGSTRPAGQSEEGGGDGEGAGSGVKGEGEVLRRLRMVEVLVGEALHRKQAREHGDSGVEVGGAGGEEGGGGEDGGGGWGGGGSAASDGAGTGVIDVTDVADVNAPDVDGNSPLHTVCGFVGPPRSFAAAAQAWVEWFARDGQADSDNDEEVPGEMSGGVAWAGEGGGGCGKDEGWVYWGCVARVVGLLMRCVG